MKEMQEFISRAIEAAPHVEALYGVGEGSTSRRLVLNGVVPEVVGKPCVVNGEARRIVDATAGSVSLDMDLSQSPRVGDLLVVAIKGHLSVEDIGC